MRGIALGRIGHASGNERGRVSQKWMPRCKICDEGGRKKSWDQHGICAGPSDRPLVGRQRHRFFGQRGKKSA